MSIDKIIPEDQVREIFSNRLHNIDATQESIENYTKYVIACQSFLSVISDEFLKFVNEPNLSSNSLLVCLFIANDVLNRTRYRHPMIFSAFLPSVKTIVSKCSKSDDPDIKTCLKQIIDLFNETKLLDQSLMTLINEIYNKNTGTSQMEEVSTLLEFTEYCDKLVGYEELEKVQEANKSSYDVRRKTLSDHMDLLRRVCSFHTDQVKKNTEEKAKLSKQIPESVETETKPAKYLY